MSQVPALTVEQLKEQLDIFVKNEEAFRIARGIAENKYRCFSKLSDVLRGTADKLRILGQQSEESRIPTSITYTASTLLELLSPVQELIVILYEEQMVLSRSLNKSVESIQVTINDINVAIATVGSEVRPQSSTDLPRRNIPLRRRKPTQ